MNKIMFSIMSLVAMTGCAGTVNSANTASNESCNRNCTVPEHKSVVAGNSEQNVVSSTNNPDTDKTVASTTGEVIGSTTRMVWDSTKKAYVYVTSDETKNKLVTTWESVKKATVDVKDGLVKGYNQ